MEYKIFHSTYSGAVASIVEAVERTGYTLDDQSSLENLGGQIWDKIAVGPSKPQEGQTNKFDLQLYKKNRIVDEALHVQIYNTGKKYELNMYIL